MLNSRWTFKLDLFTYKNDHQAAVKKLVDANRKGKPLPEPEPEPAKTKVVNSMVALRSSLAQGKKPKTTVKKTSRRSRAA
jgi:DNA end-binding protein Ku